MYVTTKRVTAKQRRRDEPRSLAEILGDMTEIIERRAVAFRRARRSMSAAVDVLAKTEKQLPKLVDEFLALDADSWPDKSDTDAWAVFTEATRQS